jgi:hypothetical protein
MPPECGLTQAEVKAFLVAAGVNADMIEFIEDADDVVFSPEDELVLILLDHVDDQGQAACALGAAQAGAHAIIGLWSRGQQQVEIPNATSRYATAQVSWDANKLARALQGKENVAFETGQGKPSQSPPMKTNQC